MTRDLLVLPDGRELFSGAAGVPAIAGFRCTRRVNDGKALDYAGACAAMIEAELLETGDIPLQTQQELRWYTVSDTGERILRGWFLTDEVVRLSPNLVRLTAYDRMLRFDTDLTGWLTELTGWPYTMAQLLTMVCGVCGVEPEVPELLNGDYPVARFLGKVTGRQLIRWIAGANAAYAMITRDGKLTFRPLAAEAPALAVKSLQLSDFSTTPIARVTVRKTQEDVGVSWPEAPGETYAITGNPLLSTDSPEALLPHVRRLADRLVGIRYTPGKGEFFDADMVCPVGALLTVTDAAGKAHTLASFSATYSGGITTVQSTGEQSRQSVPAQNKEDPLERVQGRTAELALSLEGLSARLSQTDMTLDAVQAQTAGLTLEASGIRSRVEETEEALLTKAGTAQVEAIRTQLTQVEQRSDSLTVSVQSLSGTVAQKADKEALSEVTEHFRFAADGMTITNSGTGMGIRVSEEQVAFLGSDDPTVIRPGDMQTTNLRVQTRLDLGNFSLFPRNNGNLSLRWTGGNV